MLALVGNAMRRRIGWALIHFGCWMLHELESLPDELVGWDGFSVRYCSGCGCELVTQDRDTALAVYCGACYRERGWK